MTFNESRPYQYEIGENVYVYFNEGYEPATIKDRKQEFCHNWYLVEWGWEKEAYLRKINSK